VAALGVFAIAALLVQQPVATQRNSVGSPQIVNVNGRPAIAGEVLVKYRRALRSDERVQLDQQTGADRNDAIGGAGVRRVHSRSYDTSTLLTFLRNHPDVAYAEPNYVTSVDATDAGSADRIVPVGAGLLIELPSFVGPQHAAILHEHFAGDGWVAVHVHDLRRGVGAPLRRDRLLQKQRPNGEHTESRHVPGHAICQPDVPPA